jgi:hypothetical protein
MFRVLLISLVFVLAFANSISFEKIINKIGKKDFLVYNTVTTSFGEAFIEYTIGEYHILNDKKDMYIQPINLIDASQKFAGDVKLGVDEKTANHLKTGTFTIPQDAKLQFYRNLIIRISNFNFDRHATNYYDYIDCNRYFTGGINRIKNQQEYQLHLKEYPSKKTIAILDSVGFLPNTKSYHSPPYGTNPKISNIEIDLSKYAGKYAYLQVLPIRRGTLPTKNRMWSEHSTLSKSNIKNFNYERCSEFSHLSAKIDTLEAEYLVEYLNYAEEKLQNMNNYFIIDPGSFINFNQNSDLMKNYREKYYDEIPKISENGKEYFEVHRKKHIDDEPKVWTFRELFPHVANSSLSNVKFSDNELILSFNVVDYSGFMLELYGSNDKVEYINICDLEFGEQDYTVNFGDFPAGKYYAQLIHNSGSGMIEDLGIFKVK